jgi:peptidoglycan/LPS O-acetylase OafA/YrhL
MYLSLKLIPQIYDRDLALTDTWIWTQGFVIVFVATVGFAALSYQFLEKPFLKLKTRFEFIHGRPV